MTAEMGELVAALAKAQTEFGTVTRSKTVTVVTKSGKDYSFAYAPLDTILDAVRGPLSANGLAIVQLLDDGALVTSLMHKSGAILSGRVDLPQTADIQQLGSAVTYLRRYAIQAVLGIAAEDDDDGNHAAGNTASPAPRSSRGRTSAPAAVPLGSGGTTEPEVAVVTGRVTAGGNGLDLLVRQTPDGSSVGFKLVDLEGHPRGRKTSGVRMFGPGAATVRREDLIGKDVKVIGRLHPESFEDKDTGRTVEYHVIHADAITGDGIAVMNTDAAPPADGDKASDLDELPW